MAGLSAAYEERCSNDYKYYDKYDTFDGYWNETSSCGDEGALPADLYKPFDEMSVQKFFENNHIWSLNI